MFKNHLIIFTVILIFSGQSECADNHHQQLIIEKQLYNWSTKVSDSSCSKYSKTIISENNRFQNELETKLRSETEMYLKKYSFLYSLIVTAIDHDYSHGLNNLNVNPKCLNDLKIIKNGIDDKEIWAIKMLDSSGTFKSGFILGNNYWLGSRKGCNSINGKLTLTLSKRYDRFMIDNLMNELSPIEVNFRMLHATHNSPWQLETKLYGEGILHLGLCVPQSCSNNEIKNITQHTFYQKTMQLQNIYELRPDVINVRDLELSPGFFNKITVKLFILLVTITTILSICAEYVSTDDPREMSTFERVAKCFSIKQNFDRVTKMDITPSSIPVINGLRSISCFVILLIHATWFMHYATDNQAVLFGYAENLLLQPLTNARFYLDFFFSISGFLMSFNFFKNNCQMNEIKANSFLKNVKLFGRMLLQRYVRLSPLCIVTILITEIGTAYLADVSHFYIHERNDLLFEKYWWRNLLYIQNLFPVNEMCTNWTWSLACEIQYFIVFTTILFVYAKNPERGKKLFFSLWFVLFMMTFGIAVYKNFNFALDVLFETSFLLYTASWARIHPYCIGILSAFCLHRNGGKIYINKKYFPFIWIGAATVLLVCLYGTAIMRHSHFIFASIALLSQRILFGVIGVWIIIASISGNGNWFTTFLEHRRFVHINNVSYAIYLLGPITVIMICGLLDDPVHADIMTITIIILSKTVIVYFISVPFSLLFEVPYNRLSEEFLKKRKLEKAEQ